MSDVASSLPGRIRRYGKVLYDRATGVSDEMESAKSVCEIVASFYHPGMRLLDVGCGAGHYLRSLRTRVDPELDYWGVDLTAYYIELARKAFPDFAGFSVGDACKLDFEDESFDIVLCMNVIPNLPPPPTAAIREMLRVSRRHVVIRALFSDITYIIRELETRENDGGPPFEADGTISSNFSLYNNMYTESYLRSVIEEADPSATVSIQRDTHDAMIDNRAAQGSWGTHTEGGRQISGQLLLDWRYAIVHRASNELP